MTGISCESGRQQRSTELNSPAVGVVSLDRVFNQAGHAD